MKNLLFLFALIGLLLISCDNTPTVYATRTCERPFDIPDTLRNGATVYWDCSWDASYRLGYVKVRYDTSGIPYAIERRILERQND